MHLYTAKNNSGLCLIGCLVAKGGDAVLAKMRKFSPNARLYILHVIGMDAIYGSWSVIFNLYLLAVGFSVPFVGLRLLLNSMAEALASLPAGAVSNLIGRQWSFILGDGVGASMAIVSILSKNPAVLLGAAVVSGIFTALHSNSEPAFMAENSQADERIYLFSTASGFRVASATVGALVAGWVTQRFSHLVGPVTAYREATIFGIALWFLSLVPALLLKKTIVERQVQSRAELNFRMVRHRDRIIRLALYSGFTSLAAGMVVPLFNVYFRRALGMNPLEIAIVLGAGGILLAGATFLSPGLERRFGTVRAITGVRLLAVPFILGLGFLPEWGSSMPVMIPLVVLYAGRHVLSNVVHPIASAFGMNMLDPQERSIATGGQVLLGNLAWAVAAYSGAWFLHFKGYVLLFMVTGGIYLLAQALYWRFFGHVAVLVTRDSGKKARPT